MKVVSIVGARPQFIKASPVSKALRQTEHQEFIIHTGQHYDYEMSRVFFDELELTEPHVNLEVGSRSHGKQTGEMLMQIDNVLLTEKPDCVLVYGDTNSTLAGALAAVKLHIPVAHAEAGLRSFNREMPEEHNRVLTDHMSDLLFCPSKTAVKNLEHEGITRGVHLVGDVMYDSILHNINLAERNSDVLDRLKLQPRCYALATVHRAENTDHPDRLRNIIEALALINQETQVIFPVHPRTKQYLRDSELKIQNLKLKTIDPIPYLDMLLLEKNAHVILTDSGGVQKEAYWFNVPCVTLREQTEWVELVEHGANTLAGSNRKTIYQAYRTMTGKKIDSNPELYGNGKASQKIVEILTLLISKKKRPESLF
ncbi:MAG: UDP-N-acetylglucosamine 2-epimerase (non-hydrolyzing) [Deltaproteobacteria bacterium]|nr:UDP-N-acetylglucosamine 2-epimerase (non-hydrolyzing) [Deltaproteobacteria bacterium]